jgi:EAL domain-containing protein (putative c-di-GMP-specific phosphodiesterase class I)
VAVNISPLHVSRHDFIPFIEEVLHESGLDPHYLELEVTEGITLKIENGVSTLKKLQEIGVNVAIDDFGTGYSSLKYIQNLPISVLTEVLSQILTRIKITKKLRIQLLSWLTA